MRRPLLSLLILCLLPVASAQVIPPDELNGGRAVSSAMTFPNQPGGPLVASNGSGFFAAWGDNRYGEWDAVGARYDATGAMIDSQGIPLVATYTRDTPGALISNGTDYALFTGNALGTFIVRVDPDGAVHGGGQIEALTPVAGAWNGSRYAVAFRGSERDPMQLRLFDSSLQPHESVTFGATLNFHRYAAVASSGGRFLVVWEEWHDLDPERAQRLRAQLFDDRGRPLTAARDVVTRPVEQYATTFLPAVTANGSGFLVTWREPQSIGGASISIGGDVTNTFAISATPTSGATKVAWNGSSYLVVWPESWNKTFEAARISPNADVTARFTMPVTTTVGSGPAVASNGDFFLVLAGDRRLVVSGDVEPTVRDAGPVSLAYVAQDSPVITAGKSHLLVSWFEGGRVWARKVLPNGLPLATSASHLDLGEGASYGAANAMTSASADDDLHLVAWRSAPQNRTRAALIGANGVAPVELPPSAGYPWSSASDGRGFALVWTESATPYPSQAVSLVVATVEQDGTVTTNSVAPSTWGVDIRTIGWTGTEYALVWRKYLSPPCSNAFCSRTFEERLTLLTPEGLTKSEVVLVPERWQAGIFSAVVEADGVALVSLHAATPTSAGSVTTQRFALDGTASSPVTTTGFSWTFPASTRLVKTPGGYTLLFQSIEYGPMVEWRGALHAILIDGEGRVVQDVVLNDTHVLGGAVHAFGNTWVTYTTRWTPLPQAHTGAVPRAFYRALPSRTRAVRR